MMAAGFSCISQLDFMVWSDYPFADSWDAAIPVVRRPVNIQKRCHALGSLNNHTKKVRL